MELMIRGLANVLIHAAVFTTGFDYYTQDYQKRVICVYSSGQARFYNLYTVDQDAQLQATQGHYSERQFQHREHPKHNWCQHKARGLVWALDDPEES
jgi:hypothetical protein